MSIYNSNRKPIWFKSVEEQLSGPDRESFIMNFYNENADKWKGSGYPSYDDKYQGMKRSSSKKYDGRWPSEDIKFFTYPISIQKSYLAHELYDRQF